MAYTIDIENIGGIYRGSATISEGPNAVRASNWHGKSSFIAALKTVLGVGTPLTEGADEGYVELESGDETHRVELRREGKTVVRDGDPYFADERVRVVADLFAVLDENNEVRDAVRNGKSLEDTLLRPLNVENIDEQIETLREKRERVETDLNRAEEAANRLPSIQEDVTQLETKLDNLRTKQANIRTGTTDSSERQEKRDELGDLRAERTSVTKRIDRLKSSVERIEGQLEEKRSELADHEVPDAADIEDELESNRSELQRLEQDIELLQSVYSANERILDNGRLDLLTSVDRGLMDDAIECWVCGAERDRSDLEAHIEALGERVSELESEAADHRDRVEELESQRSRRRQAEQKEQRLERKITEMEENLAGRKQSLETARERRSELDAEIEALTEAVDELDEQVTDIESEIKVAERELEEKRETLETVQERANRQSSLQEEYDEISDEIEQLRNRRDRIKRDVRESFGKAIRELVDLFETGFDGAHLTEQFELVVAREGRETSIDTLSEGERELLGVITALAGHEAFDVADDVEFMLLDDVGGFDGDNLARLIDYLDDRADVLVFTSYPEHTVQDMTTIEPADWDLVSAQVAPS